MDNNTLLKTIEQYASENNFDSWRIAGTRNGWTYYHFYNKATVGHYLGLGHYVKFTTSKQPVVITLIDELMWADEQEVLLNNL